MQTDTVNVTPAPAPLSWTLADMTDAPEITQTPEDMAAAHVMATTAPLSATATAQVDYPKARWEASGNYWRGDDPHNGRLPLRYIVLHGAAGYDPGALDWLRRPNGDSSAHYLVDRAGVTYQMVREQDVAWANGAVSVGGFPAFPNPNRASISIETEQDAGNDLAYTDAQMAAVIDLITDIRRRHGDLPLTLIPHSRVDPVNRPFCPGAKIPLAEIDQKARPHTTTPTKPAPTKPAPSPWRPVWRHITQVYHRTGDPAGAWADNDCFEASLSRYLREASAPWGGTDPGLIGTLRQAISGQPDGHWNNYTWLADINRFWPYMGLQGARWIDRATDHECGLRPWALCLVSVTRLAPRPYPDWWLAGIADEADHFILRLPDGSYNDPLGMDGDARYSDDVIRHAMDVPGAGVYQMPDATTLSWEIAASGNMVAHTSGPIPTTVKPTPGGTGTGTGTGTAPAAPKAKPAPIKRPAPPKPGPGVVTAADWLKHQANPKSPGVVHVKPGDHVLILNWVTTCGPLVFQRVAVTHQGNRLELWLLQSSVKSGR